MGAMPRSAKAIALAALSAVTLLAVSACGGDDSTTDSTLAPEPPTSAAPQTTLPTSTTGSPTTASTSSSTSTSTTSTSTTTTTAPTTTTAAPGAALTLSATGIGDAAFGVDPEPVIEYMTGVLGPPTADSGWIDPFSPFGTCPGTTVRGVSWNELLLLFGDESEESSGGRLHFFAYVYGPPLGATPVPDGLVTAQGIGLGSSVEQLQAAVPGVELFADDVFGSGFIIETRLSGNLTNTTPTGVVTAIFGGVGCGE